MTAEQLRDLAHALDTLAGLRHLNVVIPGAGYERPRVHIEGSEDTWELAWVEPGPGDNGRGHYLAKLERS